jgi:hypothetical protein
MIEPTIADLLKEAIAIMSSVKHSLKGLLIEMKTSNKRHMDASDFSINEFRQLTAAVENLVRQFEQIRKESK